MTDPRIAALAEALDAVDVRSGYRLSRMSPPMGPTTLAAAILAALPPDWCGHSLTAIEDLMDEIEKREVEIAERIRLLAEANREIARLRAIEEAARAVIVARDAWLACDDDWEDDCGHNHDVAFDALRAALGETP